jgi:hypothetical protein
MLQRLDLPIRDVLRLLLPGALGIVLFNWTYYLYSSVDLLKSAPVVYLLGYTLVIGLITFSAGFHDWLWPWRAPWRKSLEDIRLQLERITGLTDLKHEPWGKPMYKIWLDAICRPDVRGHLHYVTGLYYTSVALAVTAALAAIFSIWPFIREIALLTTQTRHGPLNPILVGGRLGSPIAEALLAYFLAKQALSYMDDVIKEGRLALQLSTSQEQLRQLAKATVESGLLAPPSGLIHQKVRECASLIRPIDAQKIKAVSEPILVDHYELRDDSIMSCAHIVAYADSYDAAVAINGRRNLYNGPTQTRIEAFIREALGPSLGVNQIRLQIAPADGPLVDCNFGTQEQKHIDRVKLPAAISIGVLSQSGIVVRLCEELGIGEILLRNGRLIGPNPALYGALDWILPRLKPGDVVYDPFCGTGLTKRMVERTGNLIPRCTDITGGVDAFLDTPTDDLALVVVDPLYEHAQLAPDTGGIRRRH